ASPSTWSQMRQADGLLPSLNGYAVFGMSIASEAPLPELPSLGLTPAPDVSICFETLPSPPASAAGPLHCVGEDTYLKAKDVGRFRIRRGREIAIDPLPGVSERDIRLFLLGPVLGLLCHQRGLLPLHASAIVADGRAVAFAGPSGIGKSTLAACFQDRGYEVLS